MDCEVSDTQHGIDHVRRVLGLVLGDEAGRRDRAPEIMRIAWWKQEESKSSAFMCD